MSTNQILNAADNERDNHAIRKLGLLLLGSAAMHMFFIFYFGDVDFEPDSYWHFIHSVSAFSRLPESLNLAAGVWPKPLFTLLTGAIMWISGIRLLWLVKVLNTCVWTAVGLLTYRAARQLKLSAGVALISAFLTEFSFLSFRSSIGTLTEPLFTLLVMGAIVALYDKKYATCCVLASLSCLVRSEGLVLLPVWAVILWFVHRRRRFLDLLLLAVFPLLWNLWGYTFTGDPTFIITSGYPFTEAPYGHGGWFDYPMGLFQYEPIIFPLALLGITLTARDNHYYPLHILCAAFFSFNIVSWRFGLFGTAGILRYFVPTVPWLALYAGTAFKFKELLSAHRRLARYGLNLLLVQVAFSILVVTSNTSGYLQYNTPTVHHALIDAGQWIKANHTGDYVYGSHPALLYYAGRDLYSGAMVWTPDSVSKEGIVAFESGFGSPALRDYLEHFWLLEVFDNYVFVYSYPGWAYFEVRPQMGFGTEDIRPHLWEGWSDPEGWGTWAVGDYSELVLYFREPQAVNIAVSAIPPPVADRKQSIAIYYNDVLVGGYEFPPDDQSVQQFSFTVSGSLMHTGIDVIRFVYGYAVSPLDMSISNDDRRLAVGFLEMRVTAE